MSIRYYVLFVFIILIAACSKKEIEVAEDTTQQQCNAVYREASDNMGRMFQFESYWVRCYGRIGASKAHCQWRQ